MVNNGNNNSNETLLEIRKYVEDKLEKIEELEIETEKIRLIDDFKRIYTKCEIASNAIMESLSKAKEKSSSTRTKGSTGGGTKREQKLNNKSVPKALKEAGYAFDEKIISMIFSSEKKSGKRSARIIRNDVTHNLTKSVIEELIERKEELFKNMNYYLDLVREQKNSNGIS